MADIGEQLAWLGAACRASPQKDKIAFCTPQITTIKGLIPKFRLDFITSNLEDDSYLDENGSCWHSLFRNAIIVKGFPILARPHDEKGLEIPLNVMAGLADASHATAFDGCLVIKGYSTMFVPTERNGDSVLWHFLYENNQGRIPYMSASERGIRQVPLEIVDTSCLAYVRNFVGWASSVLMQIGECR